MASLLAICEALSYAQFQGPAGCSQPPNYYALADHLSTVGLTRAIGEDEFCNTSKTMLLIKLSAQQDKDKGDSKPYPDERPAQLGGRISASVRRYKGECRRVNGVEAIRLYGFLLLT